MTVLDVIQRSTDFLAKKGVDSPRLQVELLLAHVLRQPRLKLYLNFERPLSDAELDAVRELVRRRSLREPLQHIIGSTSFCGLELAVNKHVLVPRPETELLVETAWTFLQSLPGEPAALDFGTGSGCLAIALAVNCPAVQITAIDICEDALAVARRNATANNVPSRIDFRLSDGFADVPRASRFNLIVANPPYIPGADIAGLEPEVRDFDPRQALDGGADGLDFYRRLSREAGEFLAAGGRIMLEFGDGQADAVKKLFEEQMWIVEAVKADYSGRQRILTARRDESAPRDSL